MMNGKSVEIERMVMLFNTIRTTARQTYVATVVGSRRFAARGATVGAVSTKLMRHFRS